MAEHNTLNILNESLEHGGMEASRQEEANSLQQATIQIQDCTETEISNLDFFEAIESCCKNTSPFPSLSRNSVSKRPKRKKSFWSGQLYKDLQEKIEAYNNLRKDFDTNHKDCKQNIESLQNKVLNCNFIINQLNLQIEEKLKPCEKCKLNDKKKISHIGEVKVVERITKVWNRLSKNVDKTEVSQKKWYKQYKAEVDHFLSNKISFNKLSKFPIPPKYHAKEDEITLSVLSPPYSDIGQSTCQSSIDIEEKGHSLTYENKKSEGDDSLSSKMSENSVIENKLMRLKIVEKKVETIFQQDFSNRKFEIPVRDYESYIEDISEELRQDVLISSLLSPIKNSDDDVDNIPSKTNEDIPSVKDQSIEGNAKKIIEKFEEINHAIELVETTEETICEKLVKGITNVGTSSEVIRRSEVIPSEMKQTFKEIESRTLQTNKEDEITLSLLSPPYSDNSQSTCQSNIYIEEKGHSLTYENKKSVGDDSLLSKMSLKSVIENIHRRLNILETVQRDSNRKSEITSKDKAAVRDYESYTEDISEELRQDVLISSLLSPIKNSDDDVDNIPNKEKNKTIDETVHRTQHLEEPSTPGISMFSPQKTILGNECLKEYEAFGPSSVLLEKKKEIARRLNTDEEKNKTIDETLLRTQHLEEPSIPGITMFSPQQTILGNECLKEYDAFAPSSVFVGKKKQIARHINTDEEKNKTIDETVPRTQHLDEPSIPGITMFSPQKTILGNECLKEYKAFAPSTVLLGKKKRIARRSISSDEEKNKTIDETLLRTHHLEEPSTPGITMFSPQQTILGNECLKDYDAFAPSSVLIGKKKEIARRINTDEEKNKTIDETVHRTQHLEEPSTPGISMFSPQKTILDEKNNKTIDETVAKTQHLEEPSTPGITMFSPQKTKLGNECLKEYDAFAPSSVFVGKKKQIARHINTDEGKNKTIDETVPRTQHLEEPTIPGITMFSPQQTILGNECLKEYEAFAPSTVLLGKKKRIARRSISSDEKNNKTIAETVPKTQHLEEPSTPGITMFSPQKTKLDEGKNKTSDETVPRTQHLEEPSIPGITMFSPQQTILGNECLKEYEAFAPSTVLLGKKKRIPRRSISSDEEKNKTIDKTVPRTQHLEEPSTPGITMFSPQKTILDEKNNKTIDETVHRTQHLEEHSTPGITMFSPQKTILGNECLKEYEAFAPSTVLLGKKKRIPRRSIRLDEKNNKTIGETVPRTQHLEEPSTPGITMFSPQKTILDEKNNKTTTETVPRTQLLEEPSTPGITLFSPQKTNLDNYNTPHQPFGRETSLLTIKKILSEVPCFSVRKVITCSAKTGKIQNELYIFDCSNDTSLQTKEDAKTLEESKIPTTVKKKGNKALLKQSKLDTESLAIEKNEKDNSSLRKSKLDTGLLNRCKSKIPTSGKNRIINDSALEKLKSGNECLKEYEAFAPSTVLLGKKKRIARSISSDEKNNKSIGETMPTTQHLEEPSTPGITMFSPQKTILDTGLLNRCKSKIPTSGKNGINDSALENFKSGNECLKEYEAFAPSTVLLGKKKRIARSISSEVEGVKDSVADTIHRVSIGKFDVEIDNSFGKHDVDIVERVKDSVAETIHRVSIGKFDVEIDNSFGKYDVDIVEGVKDSVAETIHRVSIGKFDVEIDNSFGKYDVDIEVEGVKDSVADTIHRVSIGKFDVEIDNSFGKYDVDIEVEGVKDSVADTIHRVSIGKYDVDIDYLAKKPREVVKSPFPDELEVKKLKEKINKFDEKNNKVKPVIEKKDFTPDEKNNKINPVIEKKDFTPEYFQSSNGHFSHFNHSIIKGVRTRGGIRQRGGPIRVLQKSFSKELNPCEDKERSTNINWFGKVSNTESVNENTMVEKTVNNIKGKRKSKSDKIKDLFGSFSSDDESSRNDEGQNQQQRSVHNSSFISEDLALSSSSEDSEEPLITKPIVNGERNLLSKLSSSGKGQNQKQTFVNDSSPHLAPQRPSFEDLALSSFSSQNQKQTSGNDSSPHLAPRRPSYEDLALSSSSEDSEEPLITKPIVNGERNLLSKLSSSGKGQNQKQISVKNSSPHLAPRRPSYKDLELSSSSEDSEEPLITKLIINGERNLLSKPSSSGKGQNQKQTAVNDSSPRLAPRRPSYEDLELSSSSEYSEEPLITKPIINGERNLLSKPSSSGKGQNQKQTSVNDSSPHLAPRRLSYEDFALSTSSEDSEEPLITKPIVNGERNLLSKLSSSGKGQNQKQTPVNASSPLLVPPRRPSYEDFGLSSSLGLNQKQTSVNESSPHLAPRRLSYEDFALSTSSDKDKQLSLPVIDEDIHLEETSTGKGITTMCKKEGNTHFQHNNSIKHFKSKMDMRKIFKELTVKTTPVEQETCDQLSDTLSSTNFRRSSRLSHKAPVSYNLMNRKKHVNDNVKNKQNDLKDNILVSSENSDSNDSNKLLIVEDPSICNDLSSHLFEDLNEPKSTENQPSTLSGLESKFIPSFYKEIADITEESVPYQSLTKPHELEVEDIIQIEKTSNLTLIETVYLHSNILEESFKIDGKTMDENKKWINLQQNLRKERRKCDQLYRIIFQGDTRHLLLNVQLLKKCSLPAQVKSLLDLFPTEDDISIKRPIFDPKNKDKATILQKDQFAFIRFINIHLIEFNGSHPFLKCLADEVVYYIRNFRGEELKVSKCMQVTELLAVLCNQYNLYGIAQAFIYDCLYWLKMLSFPLIYSMLKIYPHVLTHSENHIHLLNKVFVHCILHTPSTSKHIAHTYLQSLKHVLWNYYKYPKDSENSLELLKTLLRKITEPGGIESILLMCKRESHEWVYKNVVKYLIDFFMDHKMKNEDYATASMRLIGMVMKSFPQVYSEDHVNNLISILKYLLFDPKGSILVKEEIVLALCHLTRYNPKDCATILLQWQPSHNLISKNTMRIITNILTRQLSGSEWANFVLQSTKERPEICYESLSEVEDVEVM